jgi:hypothetical protein
MLRLRTPITDKELAALIALAQQEMRTPGEQAHYIIRQTLEKLRLLREENDALADFDNVQSLQFRQEDHHG